MCRQDKTFFGLSYEIDPYHPKQTLAESGEPEKQNETVIREVDLMEISSLPRIDEKSMKAPDLCERS